MSRSIELQASKHRISRADLFQWIPSAPPCEKNDVITSRSFDRSKKIVNSGLQNLPLEGSFQFTPNEPIPSPSALSISNKSIVHNKSTVSNKITHLCEGNETLGTLHTANVSEINTLNCIPQDFNPSRHLFDVAKMPENRPSIDTNALRDAVQLIPEFSGHRDDLRKNVISLEDAREMINSNLHG